MTTQITAQDSIILALSEASGIAMEDVTLETELGDEGLGLDSIAILELLLGIEAATGKVLRSEDLTADTLKTVGSLTVYVDTLDVG